MNITFFVYLILISVLAYRSKYIIAGVLGVIGTCHIAIFYAKSVFPISIFVIVILILLYYAICIYFFSLFNSFLLKKVDITKIDLQRHEEQLSLLNERDKTLKDRNEQLERSLNEVLTIYEYVRKLGSTLNFDEAVKIFEETITSLTSFASGKLVLLQENTISKVYKISNDKDTLKNIEIFSLKEYEKNLILKMLKMPQSLLYEKGKLSPLGTFPNNIETLLTFPLAVEKQLLGVIILENLPLTKTDKIHFIALQFAMEIKKTNLYNKVRELSTIDGLTQLYQRRNFLNLLKNELDRGYRQNHSLSFLMLDVDFFKKYNDEYGHLVGDFILKQIGIILKDKSREIDLLCRYGGDEFALALPRTSLQDAQIVAERLRRAINEFLFQVAKEQFQVSISIGISTCNPKDMHSDGTAETLIELADKALYQAKSQGRNRVVLSV